MKTATLIFILIFSLSQLSAQYRPPGMADMSFYNNLGDLLESKSHELQDDVFKNTAQNESKARQQDIFNALKWIGEGGYLLRLRVQEDPITRNKVPLPIEYIGVGKVPADIVIANSINPTISSSPNENLRVQSSYIWITIKNKDSRKPKLVFGDIYGEFAKQVNQKVLLHMLNKDMLESFFISQKAVYFETIKNNLYKQISDRTVASNTENLMQSFLNQAQRLKSIEEKLQKDLKKIEEANAVLKLISDLQTVLSVASLAIQISAALDDIPQASLNAATTPAEQVKVVNEYMLRKGDVVETYRQEIILEGKTHNNFKLDLENQLKTLGVPDEMIRPLLY